MTTATLYQPGRPSAAVPETGLYRLDSNQHLVPIPGAAAPFLDCASALVDVLVSGEDYIAYSVFDSEAAVNDEAIRVIPKIAGLIFSSAEDLLLRGPILVIARINEPPKDGH